LRSSTATSNPSSCSATHVAAPMPDHFRSRGATGDQEGATGAS
jgi:hypothetical protein